MMALSRSSPASTKIAVIGPNAASLAAIEGNYNAIPSHPSLPIDGIEAALRGKATVAYAQGSAYVDDLPIVLPRTALHPAADSKEDGLKGEYFSNPDFSGKPAAHAHRQRNRLRLERRRPVPQLGKTNYSVRWTGVFTPPAPGHYQLAFKRGRCYRCGNDETYALWLDGKQVYDSTQHPSQNRRGEPDPTVDLDLSRYPSA